MLANGFTNYNGDGLDIALVTLAANHAAISNVRDSNTSVMVDERKLAMFRAVAKQPVMEEAYGADGQAFRKAATLEAAILALTTWEQRFFCLKRPKIIEAAKSRAYNGAPGNATRWYDLSGRVGGYVTHMTIYNANIQNFGPYIVTSATDRAASDGLADQVLANGEDQLGIHLTAEINPHPNPNPRLFGNPPDTNRHSIYLLPVRMTWEDFVMTLTAAQNEVKKMYGNWSKLSVPSARDMCR